MTRCMFVLYLMVVVWCSSAQTASKRPNFVFLLVDDLGWTDLGCFGSDLYETPNIDKLADEGMKFTNAYAACTVCSPSRAAVLTGKYPAKLHLTDFIAGHSFVNTPMTIPDWTKYLKLEEVTLAEALGSVGYKCASIGKWHLCRRDEGPQPDHWPKAQGFHRNVGGNHQGAPGSYFWPYGRGKDKTVNRVANLPKGGEEGEYLTDRLTDEAIKILDAWKDDPFFIYLPYYTVHTPIEAKEEYTKEFAAKVKKGARHTNPKYAAMLKSLDESVGRLTAHLEKLGIADNTIIILTGDNGGLTNNPGKPERITSNMPLRNGKGSIYEGGIRVPGIIKWPGVTEPGSVSNEPIISMDYYPTMLEMAGVRGDEDHNKNVDGFSLVSLLKGPQKQLARQTIYWHYPHYHSCGGVPYTAVRMRDWKVIEEHGSGKVQLFNLAEDPGETNNLASKEPARVKQMQKMMTNWRRTMGAQMPTYNQKYNRHEPTGVQRGTVIRPAEDPYRF
ncbi:sulfatase [Verrucomicrobia bacterium]|nr:sulfatase [Verrucomicrobiota bacterium]